MNSKRASHEHVLWPLDNLIIISEEIALLESLEAEEVVIEVTGVIKLGIDLVNVCPGYSHDILADETGWSTSFICHLVKCIENFHVVVISLLMQIANLNSGSKL